MEIDDLDTGRELTQSVGLRDAMQRTGVTDHPDVYVLEQVESVRA